MFILQFVLGDTIADRLVESQSPTQAFPITVAILHTLVLVGSAIYRLDRKNDVKKDFVLPADALFHKHRDMFQLFAPFLQADPANTAYRRFLPKISDQEFSEASRFTTPSDVDGAPTFHHSGYEAAASASSSHRQVTIPITARGTAFPVALPFYLPSPMPQYRPLPLMVRPTLMNPWSGVILCEYSDYKRLNDCVAPPCWRESAVATDMVSEDASSYEPNPLPCHVWEQYTLKHLGTLSCTEQALRTLYAYHSIGTLAASIVAAQNDDDLPLTPGSRTVPSPPWSGIADAESDASSLGNGD